MSKHTRTLALIGIATCLAATPAAAVQSLPGVTLPGGDAVGITSILFSPFGVTVSYIPEPVQLPPPARMITFSVMSIGSGGIITGMMFKHVGDDELVRDDPIDLDPEDDDFDVTPVPEPSAALAFGAGAAFLATRIRRRR